MISVLTSPLFLTIGSLSIATLLSYWALLAATANFANLSSLFSDILSSLSTLHPVLIPLKLLLIYLHDPAHTQNILHLLPSSKPYLSFKAQGIHYLLLSLSSSYLLSCLSSMIVSISLWKSFPFLYMTLPVVTSSLCFLVTLFLPLTLQDTAPSELASHGESIQGVIGLLMCCFSLSQKSA